MCGITPASWRNPLFCAPSLPPAASPTCRLRLLLLLLRLPPQCLKARERGPQFMGPAFARVRHRGAEKRGGWRERDRETLLGACRIRCARRRRWLTLWLGRLGRRSSWQGAPASTCQVLPACACLIIHHYIFCSQLSRPFGTQCTWHSAGAPHATWTQVGPKYPSDGYGRCSVFSAPSSASLPQYLTPNTARPDCSGIAAEDRGARGLILLLCRQRSV
jgi:hypothetical protein